MNAREFWANEATKVKNTSVLSDTMNSDSIEATESYPMIIITDNPSGWTLSRVINGNPTYYFPVRTYYAFLVSSDAPSKNIAYFSITRDGYMSRGQEVQGGPELLANQAFEPNIQSGYKEYSANINVYYPKNSIFVGYALLENGSINVEAEPHIKEQMTYWNGQNMNQGEGHSRNPNTPNIANSIMFHIGGYYQKNLSTPAGVAASLGCFGFVPPKQNYSTREDVENIIKNKGMSINGTSNDLFKALCEDIKKANKNASNIDKDTQYPTTIKIRIHKRNNVEKFTSTKK